MNHVDPFHDFPFQTPHSTGSPLQLLTAIGVVMTKFKPDFNAACRVALEELRADPQVEPALRPLATFLTALAQVAVQHCDEVALALQKVAAKDAEDGIAPPDVLVPPARIGRGELAVDPDGENPERVAGRISDFNGKTIARIESDQQGTAVLTTDGKCLVISHRHGTFVGVGTWTPEPKGGLASQ